MEAGEDYEWRHSDHWEPGEAVVCGSQGMVASSHPLASEAGVGVLRKGGNAVDAAIAVAAVMAVVMPCSNGIAGDNFALFYDASSRTVTGVEGSGRAPAALTAEIVRQSLSPAELGKVKSHAIGHWYGRRRRRKKTQSLSFFLTHFFSFFFFLLLFVD
ncbi:MAG: gamma-glutamyltransferase [archaeon]|nr:gamma-glutamyltransferase [archaeon]